MQGMKLFGICSIASFAIGATTLTGTATAAGRADVGKGFQGSNVTAAAEAQVLQRADPKSFVDDTRVLSEQAAAQAVPSSLGPSDFRGAGPRAKDQPFALSSRWQELGPVIGQVPPVWATNIEFFGQQETFSGRVTALAVDRRCGDGAHGCRVWVGAAGGGVWRTSDALASSVQWEPVSNGLPTNAIGSLILDPTDRNQRTLYAGTGEVNTGSDTEAGLGLYKSTDAGAHWTLVPGSFAVAKDRAIGAIAVDPTNPRHLYIGTGVGRHESSANRGPASTGAPPDAPTMGVYESTDGGRTFALAFSRPQDTGAFITPRGGVNSIELDPRDPQTVYAALFDYGVWRRSARLDGDRAFHQVYAPLATPPNEPNVLFRDRAELALTTTPAGHTRMYVGDGWEIYHVAGDAAVLRADNVDVPASSLTDGTGNPGFTSLTSATDGEPGFATKDYCGMQCAYDNVVAVDPTHPDTVWIGGQAQFEDAGIRSFARGVMRSTDAGVHWTDMTADAENPPFDIHPDQHAFAFDPHDPRVVLIGNDGGVYRTDGSYVDGSGWCSRSNPGVRPPLTGAELAECQSWLRSIPHRVLSLNAGLADLQFQTVTINPSNPTGSLLAGTQDNGTFAYTGSTTWNMSLGGDGGSSGFDVANPQITYGTAVGIAPGFSSEVFVNFHANDPLHWDAIFQPLLESGERGGFFKPLVADPAVGGTAFAGLQHVWRTTDHGGAQSVLDPHCSVVSGDFAVSCGDFQPLGIDLTSTSFGDRTGPNMFIGVIARTPSDSSTLWAATRYGRVFISHNADASDPTTVKFTRVDVPSTPTRYPTGIAIDPGDPNHAWVSFNGYDANTPSTPGHVFDVQFDPDTGTATWTDVSYNLGDQPVTNVAHDEETGDLYASTDFGVLRLPADATSWEQAARGLPKVATYGLAIAPKARVLYAATHGRGVWRVQLPGESE